MNAFERFNIRYLSPTMIAQWDNAPATLILKRVYGVKTQANANMWRGDAVEAALQFILSNPGKPDLLANAQKLTEETFWHRAAGEVDEDTEKAASLLPGMVEQAFEFACSKTSRIMGTQFNVEGFLDDVSAPVTGKIDFIFDDKSIVELKTTTRCPSKIESVSLSHRWQAAFYAEARQQPVELLYVTDKKHASFMVEPGDTSLLTLTQAAKSLEVALERCEDGDKLLRSLPPVVQSFYWDDDTMEAYEKALNGDLKPLVGPGTESLAAQGYITFGKHAGKHISDVPDKYLDWLLNPKLSDGGTFDVPEDLQDAIRELREAV